MKKLKYAIKIVGCTLLALATILMLAALACGSGGTQAYTGAAQVNVELMDRFDQSLTNQLSDAMEGVLSILIPPPATPLQNRNHQEVALNVGYRCI